MQPPINQPRTISSTSVDKVPENHEHIIHALISLLPLSESKELQDFYKKNKQRDFISKTLLFRGISNSALQEFLKTGIMQPQIGQHNSIGVFASSRPMVAEEFMILGNPANQFMVVFEKQKIKFKHDRKIIDLEAKNSDALKDMESYINSRVLEIQNDTLLSDEQKQLAITNLKFEAQNEFDEVNKDVWSLREAQTIEAVKAIILRPNSSDACLVFDPKKLGHLLLLQELIDTRK